MSRISEVFEPYKNEYLGRWNRYVLRSHAHRRIPRRLGWHTENFFPGTSLPFKTADVVALSADDDIPEQCTDTTRVCVAVHSLSVDCNTVVRDGEEHVTLAVAWTRQRNRSEINNHCVYVRAAKPPAAVRRKAVRVRREINRQIDAAARCFCREYANVLFHVAL